MGAVRSGVMSVMIYDTANSAFKDIQAMQRYDPSANAWKECTSAQVQENGAWVEKWNQIKDLIVGIDIPLSQGSFKNVTPSYFNGDNGSAGFTITGTATNNIIYVSGYSYCDDSTWLRWDLSYDLTKIKEIVFSAKKNSNNGGVGVLVTDGLYYAKGCGYTPYTETYAHIRKSYNDLDTKWHDYTLDVSEITGTHIISFVGGYTDPSGNRGSSTSYKNIILKGA